MTPEIIWLYTKQAVFVKRWPALKKKKKKNFLSSGHMHNMYSDSEHHIIFEICQICNIFSVLDYLNLFCILKLHLCLLHLAESNAEPLLCVLQAVRQEEMMLCWGMWANWLSLLQDTQEWPEKDTLSLMPALRVVSRLEFRAHCPRVHFLLCTILCNTTLMLNWDYFTAV